MGASACISAISCCSLSCSGTTTAQKTIKACQRCRGSHPCRWRLFAKLLKKRLTTCRMSTISTARRNQCECNAYQEQKLHNVCLWVRARSTLRLAQCTDNERASHLTLSIFFAAHVRNAGNSPLRELACMFAEHILPWSTFSDGHFKTFSCAAPS